MKNYFFLLSLFIFLTACGQTQNEDGRIAETIPVSEWKEKMKNDPGLVLDVRTPGECAEGMIANAVNMDVNGADFEKQVETLDKNKTVYVYCRSGKRGTTAMNMLKEKGFKKVYNLEGGILAWE